MKKRLADSLFVQIALIIFFVIFLHCAAGPIMVEAAEDRKTVLIINSYHKGLKWTDLQNEGTINALKNSGYEIEIMVEYLDWKRHRHKEDIEIIKELLKHKYSDKKIDILMTTDDAALEFAIRNRAEVFGNIPIVFSGVFKEKADIMMPNQRNITGVYETIDSYGTLQLALRLNPNISDIYLIYENSESGIVAANDIELSIARIALNKIKVHRLKNNSLDEIKKIVSTLHKNSIIILGPYTMDGKGLFMEPEEFCKIISNASSVPMYDVAYDFRLGSGVLGGSILSAEQQGSYSANLAIKILAGHSADSLKPIMSKRVQNMFDYRQLERYKISLDLLPENSIIINKPFSFFEAYKNIVYTAAVIFILLVTYITILLKNIDTRTKVEKQLKKSNIEISALYHQLAASDDELKRQLEEIVSSRNLLEQNQNIIHNLAYYDQLTNLPNRESLKEYVTAELKDINGSTRYALIYVDMDNFKMINDTFGHSYGDRFLIDISNKLKHAECSNASVFRIGGDEFVIILERIESLDYVTEYLESLIHMFKEPFYVEENILNISFCAGIAIYPDDGENYGELLKNADIAMYSVKEKGKNAYAYYNSVMNKVLSERISILSNLKSAVSNNEFTLHYQPQYDVRRKKVVGLEALIRWNNPQLGFVPPDKFIAIAEESGLIIEIGDWVLENACRFILHLSRSIQDPIIVSVNISTLQLVQSDFVSKVKSIAERHGIPPHTLGIEITESTLLDSFESNVEKIEDLRNYGIKISLDDFGKGYSSLTYLMRLSIDMIKIDKSFVDDIIEESRGIKIIGSIVQLAHNMGLGVVAEGVESEQQLRFLKSDECDIIQGYLISKPLPEQEIIEFLKNSEKSSNHYSD